MAGRDFAPAAIRQVTTLHSFSIRMATTSKRCSERASLSIRTLANGNPCGRRSGGRAYRDKREEEEGRRRAKVIAEFDAGSAAVTLRAIGLRSWSMRPKRS